VDSSEAVWVLDEDPDLGRKVDGPRRSELQARAVAPLLRLGPGRSDLATLVPPDENDLGVLVLDGLLARNVVVAGATFTELVGTGDLLRPRDDLTDPKSLRGFVAYTVMESTRLALLDHRFARRVAPWLPAIAPVLLERTVQRARWLTLRLAINETRRIDQRLLLLLWHLADRWGRIECDATCLPLRLTHAVLARMVGAHRSSVTTALNRLVEEGHLSRNAHGAWVLHGAAPIGSRNTRALAHARPVLKARSGRV
jgi:CRP/FNR family cyclic AMP-dependent transcriptional regulator